MSEPAVPNRPGTAQDPSARPREEGADPGPATSGGLRSDDLTGELRETALVKAQRVLELIRRERQHRRAGHSAPVTAHDRHHSSR